MRKYFYYILLAISTPGLLSCETPKKNQVFLSLATSGYNIFNTYKTEYTFKRGAIFSLDGPYGGMYSSFIKSNYILVDNTKISELSLYSDCEGSYKKNSYSIKELKKGAFDSFNFCDVYIFPVIDFSMKVGEQKSYISRMNVRLKQKFYDAAIQDTVYQFIRRKRGAGTATVINATKKHSFIGVYEVSIGIDRNAFIKYPMGRVYLNDTIPVMKEHEYKLLKPAIDLSLIKEFN